MKIIITGAAGFVGSNVAKRLISFGCQNIMLVDDYRFGSPMNLKGHFITNSDFKDIPDLELNKYDILIHCATSNIIYAMDHPIETFQNNSANTIRLFQRFKGKIVYTSTASVYGQASILPTPETAQVLTNNAYDQSKYIAELFLQQRGNYSTLRLSNVYGPNQRADNPYCGVIGKLIYNILNHKQTDINGDGTQTRDYTFVDDVSNAVSIAAFKDAYNTEINIATGIETSILDLVKMISSITRIDPFDHYIQKRKIDGISRRCLDIRKAKKQMGWEPHTTIEEGIRKTIKWMKSINKA